MENTDTVRVPLTVEERAGKADEMARLALLIAKVEDEAKASAKKFREEIAVHLSALQTIAYVVNEGAELKAQGELHFDDFAAKEMLFEAGKRACSCEGGPDSDVKSPACPVHGVDAPAEVEAMTTCDGNHALATPCEDPECWQGTPAQKAELLAAGVEAAGTDEQIAEDVAAANDAEGEEERVVDMAEHLRANAVDVGTVEEPESVKAHRARRARR